MKFEFGLFRLTLAIIVMACALVNPAAIALANQSDAVALSTLQAQAEQGDEKALLRLAAMYLEGQGVEADVQKSLEYFRLAAERDIAYAQYRLAQIYLEGRYTEIDAVRGEAWLLRAAQLGFVPAQLDLSQRYEQAPGAARDLVSAYKWLTIAESLTQQDLFARREELEARMSYLQRAQGEIQARLCMLRAYEDC